MFNYDPKSFSTQQGPSGGNQQFASMLAGLISSLSQPDQAGPGPNAAGAANDMGTVGPGQIQFGEVKKPMSY